MTETDEEYKKRVWRFLEKMKPDVCHTIESLAEVNTREKFIEAIKEYMDALPWQGWLNFNADFSRIYKIHPIIFEK